MNEICALKSGRLILTLRAPIRPSTAPINFKPANSSPSGLSTPIRITGRAAYPHDALYLRQAAIDWLAAWLTPTDNGDSLMGSLASGYGAEAVAQLLANLSATDSMAILQARNSRLAGTG